MSNKYVDHLLVLPEDDANRQIINGFILHHSLNSRAIQIEPEAGGWAKARDDFASDYINDLRKYSSRRMVLVIDFDDKFEYRLTHLKCLIPADLKDRVFILGSLSNPEKLRTALGSSFENIGKSLSDDCADNTREMWGHDLLKHNEPELAKMIEHVKPFLFKD